MTKAEFNEQAQNIMERGKAVVVEGNQRHLVLRKQDGTQLFETSLTVVAAVAFVALITGFLSWPIVLIAAIAAYASKVKVELRQDNQVNAEK